ncbi:MAG: hypothetical protein KME59_12750 [Trichormus sp. ATA11-4-KO1]|nr:hypothetical protein [Trichormus sp. ATA11-4-KO1]
MKTLNKIGRGVAFAGATFALGTAVAVTANVGSAQAATLTGTLNIVGDATIVNGAQLAPVNDTIIFDSATVGNLSSGSFAGFIGQNATMSDVSLTQIAGTSYSGSAVNPLITLGGLIFNVDNPFSVERLALPGGVRIAVTDQGITGTFIDASGSSLGRGALSINSINADGSYSASLSTIPEPGTTAALAALGLGAFFTNSLAKKKKENVNA